VCPRAGGPVERCVDVGVIRVRRPRRAARTPPRGPAVEAGRSVPTRTFFRCSSRPAYVALGSSVTREHVLVRRRAGSIPRARGTSERTDPTPGDAARPARCVHGRVQHTGRRRVFGHDDGDFYPSVTHDRPCPMGGVDRPG
jgi:hypothetical protein